MKENVTKFDFDAAFKALDEIEVPKVKGIRPNKMDLSESVKRVDRFEMLLEDYYDIQNQGELEEAQDDRAGEVAQAKLARIEKIVDLDAESEEDLLTSYVGKVIMQCPNCMTLFYKDPEDIEHSEDDDSIVNVNEVCQHCGNDSGYTLIGKVAEEEVPETEVATEGEDLGLDEVETEDEENVEEEAVEDTEGGEDDFNLDFDVEEEEVEESFHNSKMLKDFRKKNAMETKNHSENLTLNEDIDNEECENCENGICECGDKKITEDAESELNKYLANLGGVSNESLEEGVEEDEIFDYINSLPEGLNEDMNGVSAKEFHELVNNPIYYEELEEDANFDRALERIENAGYEVDEDESIDDADDIVDEALNTHISNYLTEVYSNIAGFNATGCQMDNKNLVVEGVITFKSGKTKNTTFNFVREGKQFKGSNALLAEGLAYTLDYSVKNRAMIVENLHYRYKINEDLVEGETLDEAGFINKIKDKIVNKVKDAKTEHDFKKSGAQATTGFDKDNVTIKCYDQNQNLVSVKLGGATANTFSDRSLSKAKKEAEAIVKNKGLNVAVVDIVANENSTDAIYSCKWDDVKGTAEWTDNRQAKTDAANQSTADEKAKAAEAERQAQEKAAAEQAARDKKDAANAKRRDANAAKKADAQAADTSKFYDNETYEQKMAKLDKIVLGESLIEANIFTKAARFIGDTWSNIVNGSKEITINELCSEYKIFGITKESFDANAPVGNEIPVSDNQDYSTVINQAKTAFDSGKYQYVAVVGNPFAELQDANVVGDYKFPDKIFLAKFYLKENGKRAKQENGFTKKYMKQFDGARKYAKNAGTGDVTKLKQNRDAAQEADANKAAAEESIKKLTDEINELNKQADDAGAKKDYKTAGQLQSQVEEKQAEIDKLKADNNIQ